jgi:GntR family transcriptional regulator, rspAB operon transcriptional repressor
VAQGSTERRSFAAAGSLADDAYRYVRREILAGRIAEGDVVAEGTVAAQLGISKTPVRQALQSLRREGLLEVGSRRQLIVRGISQEHRREVHDVREALESLVVRRACTQMSVEDVDYLRLLLMRQKRAVDARDEETFIELDEAFHLYMAEASGLSLVERFLNQLRGFVRIMRLGTTRSPDHLEAVYQEHLAILDAIEARRPAQAVRALREHLARHSY